MVGSTHARALTTSHAAKTGERSTSRAGLTESTAATHRSENELKKVREIPAFELLAPAAALTTESTPSGRRLEALAVLPVCTESVVFLPFLRVFQDLVGFTDLLELVLGARLFIYIRVVLTGELPVLLANLFLARLTVDPKYLVIVFVFDGSDSSYLQR